MYSKYANLQPAKARISRARGHFVQRTSCERSKGRAECPIRTRHPASRPASTPASKERNQCARRRAPTAKETRAPAIVHTELKRLQRQTAHDWTTDTTRMHSGADKQRRKAAASRARCAGAALKRCSKPRHDGVPQIATCYSRAPQPISDEQKKTQNEETQCGHFPSLVTTIVLRTG